MLCLQVRKHEPIQIGDDITVEVIAGLGTVKLGITAPPEIPIIRDTAIDRTPRHTDAKLDVMAGLVRGEPLHKLEERLDVDENVRLMMGDSLKGPNRLREHNDACRPAEVDMITPPHEHDVLTENRHLRAEVARLKAELRKKGRVG